MNRPVLAMVLALAGGGLAGAGVTSMLAWPRAGAGKVSRVVARLVAEARSMLVVLVRLDAPLTSARRRSLRAVAAIVGLAAGALLGGTRGAVLVAVAGAWLAPRLVTVRRARRVRQIEEGAGAAASALASALAGSASLRSAIAIAAAELRGEIGRELTSTAMELEMGAGTDVALGRLRTRCSSRSVTLIVAAMQIQRRTGGDLARSLRDIAGSIEQERRVTEEAQAATSQARFTAAVVIALPLCGLLLGELAAPGMVGRIAASGPALALFVAAVALQALGAIVIRRLARPWP